MIVKTLCAGSGGQGVLTLGNVMGNAAMLQGFHATYLPAYGAAMRGGTANCTITIADEEIASPVASAPDIVVALNQPSAAAFINRLVPGGKLIYNSSVTEEVPERTDIETFAVPANDLAVEMGNPRSANMIMLGAFAQLAGVPSREAIFSSLELLMGNKKAVVEAGRQAVIKGMEYVS
ncbi:MAG: 2-oxoacid:ferredoxin oxidoreductase subunit gamma [Deltaproteobacteria bacterium]|nr:2-oxoacid:ferredoxin oxidoreductase subunit gamma [Deltaproteobacteria bacterium]